MEDIGHSSVDRGDGASQYMIVAMKNSKPFDGEHIEVVFYHTEDMSVSRRIRTKRTDGSVSISESETLLTVVNFGLEFFEFSREIFHIRTIRFE